MEYIYNVCYNLLVIVLLAASCACLFPDNFVGVLVDIQYIYCKSIRIKSTVNAFDIKQQYVCKVNKGLI
jgi:hypothetical protein